MKVDMQGLSTTFMTLGQLDEAVKTHLEDAEKDNRPKDVEALHNASVALNSAQTSLNEVFQRNK